jgi:hypothetical protein
VTISVKAYLRGQTEGRLYFIFGETMKKRNWTDEETELFINLYPTRDSKDLSVIFGRTKCALESRASKLGIKKYIKADGSKIFTEEEKEYLKKNYLDNRLSVMAKKLNRSVLSLKRLVVQLGLKSGYWWNSDEELFLVENYSEGDKEYLCEFLNKNWKAIRKKARVMGLKRKKPNGASYYNKNNPLTEEELSFIEENSESMLITEMAKSLNRSAIFIKNTCEKYELNFLTVGSFGKKCYSKNGDSCYSLPEKIITDFLIDSNIDFDKDVPYSKIIQSFSKKYRTDWVLFDGTIVEYFGVMGEKEYDKKTLEKIKICYRNNLNLVILKYEDLNNLSEIFENYLI